MNKYIISSTLEKILEDVSGIKNISDTKKLIELGFNSLKMIELEWKIFEVFGVEVELENLFTFTEMSELVDLIHLKLENADTVDTVGDNNQMSEQKKITSEDIYVESTDMQKNIYVHSMLEPQGLMYNTGIVIASKKAIDIDKFNDAVRKVVSRHEALRTAIIVHKGQIMQQIKAEVSFDITLIDDPKKIDKTHVMKPFDLSKAPLFRATILKKNEEEFDIGLEIHHIVGDGISFNIIWDEIWRYYWGEDLEPLKYQFRDFINWKNELLSSEKGKKQEKFWLDMFEKELPVLRLPYDRNRPSNNVFAGSTYEFRMDQEAYNKIKEFSLKHNLTVNMFILSVLYILLSKYGNQEDVVIGMPSSGRRLRKWYDVVGVMINTLPLRAYPTSEKKIIDFFEEVRLLTLLGIENQDYTYTKLLKNPDIEWDIKKNPLINVLYTIQEFNMELDSDVFWYPDYGQFTTETSKFDLTLITHKSLEEHSDLELSFEYSTDLFNESTIKEMAMQFTTLVKDILKNPDNKIANLLIAAKEEFTLLDKLNNTEMAYPKDKLINEIFEEQVVLQQNKIAIKINNEQITYKELNSKANQLARVLRENGVTADECVCVMIDKSLEMVIAVLAVIKAGGAYVPIDPFYPEERIAHILVDSVAKIVLINGTVSKEIIDNKQLKAIDVSDEQLFTGDDTNLENITKPNNLFYVLYTSGSTGKPKGSMIEHRNLCNAIMTNKSNFSISENDIWTMSMSFCFDYSYWELFGALLHGGTLVLVPKEVLQKMNSLSQLLVDNKVTIFSQTPSFVNLLIRNLIKHPADISLRAIMPGGEKLIPNKFIPFKEKYPNVEIFNMYGPTETTVFVLYKQIDNETLKQSIGNIGKPVANTKIYILDENKQIQPIGVPGELYISGDNLSRGYLNNTELTKQKFIANPYLPNQLMYATGDYVKMLPNGDTEYLDRIDFQVKISGHRVEIGEVEHAIFENENIKDAVVIAKDNGLTNYLAAYIIVQGEKDIKDLENNLRKRLPYYMIPDEFTVVDEFPLTSNGKVDRAKLTNMSSSVDKETTELSKEEIKEIDSKVYQIFCDVLRKDEVDRSELFFSMSANSLNLIELIMVIYDEFGVNVNLIDIYDFLTVNFMVDLVVKSLMESSNIVESSTVYFAFPSILGIKFEFNHLSNYLADHELHVFSYIDTDDKIESYCKTILEKNPVDAPITLISYSAGIFLAFDVAEYLENNNKTVEKIIAIDGYFEYGKNEVKEISDELINAELPKFARGFGHYIKNHNAKYSLNADVYHIKSETNRNVKVSHKHLTSGNCYTIQGYGEHSEMLNEEFVQKNGNIIEEILTNKINFKGE